MKRIVFWTIASLCLILYLIANFSDPGEKIKHNFKQACQEVILAREMENSSYVSAFKKYKNAIARLNNITDKYSSSDIALKLFNNQLKIGPYPFLEFKEEVVPQAKLRAEAENDSLDCAFYAVNLMDTIPYDDKLKVMKAAKLTNISILYTKNWRFRKAAATLSEAKKIVATIYSDTFKIGALTEMAQILEKVGKKKEARQLLDQALALVKTIPQNSRPEAFHKLLTTYCLIGDFETAANLINGFQATNSDQANAIISQHYAREGKLKSALDTAEKIKDDNLQAETLRVIVENYAAKGRYEKAGELALKINPSQLVWKAKALADIAFYAAQDGKKEIAASYFNEAERTAALFESFELPQKLSVINYITLRFIEIQDQENTRRLLKSSFAEAIKLPEFNRAEAFADIAVAYGRLGELEKAMELVKLYIPSFLSLDIRGNTLAELALFYAENQQYPKALELANQVAAETTLPEVNRASVLSEIAIIAAKAGDLQTGLEITRQIDCSFYKPWTLGEIALQLPCHHYPLFNNGKNKGLLHQIISELNHHSNPVLQPITALEVK